MQSYVEYLFIRSDINLCFVVGTTCVRAMMLGHGWNHLARMMKMVISNPIKNSEGKMDKVNR